MVYIGYNPYCNLICNDDSQKNRWNKLPSCNIPYDSNCNVKQHGVVGIAFSQSASNQTVEEMNQTAAELNQTLPESMNQTAAQMNQSAAQMGNQTTTNQTTTNQTSMSKLTITDVEDIRKSLEDVRKSLADGNAVDALKTVNEIDDKLLVSMGNNPPSMLEKSTDNDNDNDNDNN